MKKKTLFDMQLLADRWGGKCLSSEYRGSHSHLEWECELGHRWNAIPTNISSGRWCPICSVEAKTSEGIVRIFIETMTGKKFRRVFLPELDGLELDGYNEELRLAFEHHGIQHYKFTPRFHKSKAEFIGQNKRDSRKRRLCKKSNIKLIIIPALFEITKLPNLGTLLQNELSKVGVDFEIIENFEKISFKGLANRFKIEKTTCLREIAKQRGGSLLSELFLSAKVPLKWQCAKGHIWESLPMTIDAGSWCPKCGRESMIAKQKHDINLIRKKAIERGGELLSREYSGAHTKLQFKCKLGHNWEASANNVIRGSWCPVCANNLPIQINDVIKLAKERKGQLLSKKVTGSHEKLKWKCNICLNEWQTSAAKIKQGQWCPTCSRERSTASRIKYSVEFFEREALQRGWKCLSKNYINFNTPLKFKCANKHQFEMMPSSFLRGSDCRRCADIRAGFGRRKYDLRDVNALAASKMGRFLSKEVETTRQTYRWECDKGHTFEKSINKILTGQWCPKCIAGSRGKKLRLGLNKALALGKKRGLNLLSKEYINNHEPLSWECDKGHQFESCMKVILRYNKFACPVCRKMLRT